MKVPNQKHEKSSSGVSRRSFMKLAAAVGATAATAKFAFPAKTAEAAATYNWTDLSGPKLRFTVHSDTHFCAAGAENKFAHAFEQIYQAVPDCALHVFAGDSTNSGADYEYADLAAASNSAMKSPAIFAMGNHEFRGGGTALSGDSISNFKDFLAALTMPNTPQKPGGTHEGEANVHAVFGGYHFIAVSCGPGYWYGDAIDEKGTTRLEWMRQHIAEAVANDPSKPVFFFTHHPFTDTVHYSPGPFEDGWVGDFSSAESPSSNDTSFYDELCTKYPQLVHFSGHTHIPLEDPRSIYQDGFTLVQTSTFGNDLWVPGGRYLDGFDCDGETYGNPSDAYNASQCLLIEVDPARNHEVTIRRMDFRQDAYVGTPWTFTVSEKSSWDYRPEKREAASRAPRVEAGALSVPSDTITESSASFSIRTDKVVPDTTGLTDDIVIAYRVEVLAADGSKAYNACYMSDYYRAAEDQAVEFNRPLFEASLSPESNYILRAYAQNPWRKETLIGEVAFATLAGAAVNESSPTETSPTPEKESEPKVFAAPTAALAA